MGADSRDTRLALDAALMPVSEYRERSSLLFGGARVSSADCPRAAAAEPSMLPRDASINAVRLKPPAYYYTLLLYHLYYIIHCYCIFVY